LYYDVLSRTIDVKRRDATPVVISDRTTGYDEAGDVISSVVDPSGKHLVTSTTYDGAGRRKNVIAPPANPDTTDPTDPTGVSNVTTSTYDADSHLTDTRVTNPRVSTTGTIVGETTVGYDALGRATQKVEQAQVQTAEPSVAQTTSFQYDADGRATRTTDASGTTTARGSAWRTRR
jgi:YD repeat-containing protein